MKKLILMVSLLALCLALYCCEDRSGIIVDVPSYQVVQGAE